MQLLNVLNCNQELEFAKKLNFMNYANYTIHFFERCLNFWLKQMINLYF